MAVYPGRRDQHGPQAGCHICLESRSILVFCKRLTGTWAHQYAAVQPRPPQIKLICLAVLHRPEAPKSRTGNWDVNAAGELMHMGANPRSCTRHRRQTPEWNIIRVISFSRWVRED